MHEVASAFVAAHAATEKRIQRAKQRLAETNKLFEIAAGSDFTARLPAVHRAIYLLFNEGYHGASSEAAIWIELCREAIRLASLLLDHPQSATPTTYALLSLMCLTAARLPSRVDADGRLNDLLHQDRSNWDLDLMAQGMRYLEHSASGADLTSHHVEAAIAATHSTAPQIEKIDWHRLVSLYDVLLTLLPSPVVALNRAIAVAQIEGPEGGLRAINSIGDSERLAKYPFYFAALGDFEFRLER